MHEFFIRPKIQAAPAVPCAIPRKVVRQESVCVAATTAVEAGIRPLKQCE